MAIKAGGKKIVFSGKTATATDSSGKTQTFTKSSTSGRYTAVAPSAPSTETKISVVSDALADVGKTFGGIPIQSPQEYAQTSSGQALQQAQLKKLSSDIENKILTGGVLSAEDVRRAQAIGIRDKQLLKYADELRKYNKASSPTIQPATSKQVFGEKKPEQLFKPTISNNIPEFRPLQSSFALKKPENSSLPVDRTLYLNPLRFVGGIAAGVITTAAVIKSPSLFIKGAKQAINNPVGTLTATAYGFASDPFGFYGEGLVYSKVLSMAGKGFKFANTKINTQLGQLKTRINTNINKFEKTKAVKPKLEIAKQVRNDLKQIDNIIKKEVVIKRLPLVNKIPVISPKTKKISGDAPFTNKNKFQEILDNTLYNKETLKSISKEAAVYGYVIKPVKLNKPIFDLTNNRIITMRLVLAPKSLKSAGNGKLSRLEKKQAKRVLSEKEIAVQLKKQIKTKEPKIIDISEVKLVDELITPTVRKDIFTNKKAQTQLTLFKQEVKKVVVKEKIRYNKQTRPAINKLKLMSRRGNRKKLTAEKKTQIKQDLNKLAKEYNRVNQKVKVMEKLSSNKKLNRVLANPLKDLKNIKFAMAQDIKFVLGELKAVTPLKSPARAQKPKLDLKKGQKPQFKQAQDQARDFKRPQDQKPKNIVRLKPQFKITTPRRPIEPKKEIIKPFKKFKVSPDIKKLENRVLTYRGIYRERKNPNLPAGTRNPIVTKSITIRDTKNRALQRVAQRVDTSLVRSMQLQVTGIGKYKRDIQKPSILNKFRMKKSKNTPVLSLVEKAKYLLDARREKMESLRAKLRSKSMANIKKSSKNGYKRPKRFK